MRKPLTRGDVILAAHALFNAQMGEMRAYMERPVWPNGPDGYELATIPQLAKAGLLPVDDNYGPGHDTVAVERIEYQTFRYFGNTKEETLQLLWDDIKRIWLVSPSSARLYWRLDQRIILREKLERVICEDGPGTLTVGWEVRTRMAFPDTPGRLQFGTAEGGLSLGGR